MFGFVGCWCDTPGSEHQKFFLDRPTPTPNHAQRKSFSEVRKARLASQAPSNPSNLKLAPTRVTTNMIARLMLALACGLGAVSPTHACFFLNLECQAKEAVQDAGSQLVGEAKVAFEEAMNVVFTEDIDPLIAKAQVAIDADMKQVCCTLVFTNKSYTHTCPAHASQGL